VKSDVAFIDHNVMFLFHHTQFKQVFCFVIW